MENTKIINFGTEERPITGLVFYTDGKIDYKKSLRYHLKCHDSGCRLIIERDDNDDINYKETIANYIEFKDTWE